MAINPHRLAVTTQNRGVGPKKAAKIVGLGNNEQFSDFPDPEVEGEVRLVIAGEASVRNDASQLAKLYVAVDLEETGLVWVRASVAVTGQDTRTGRQWNHLAALRKSG